MPHIHSCTHIHLSVQPYVHSIPIVYPERAEAQRNPTDPMPPNIPRTYAAPHSSLAHIDMLFTCYVFMHYTCIRGPIVQSVGRPSVRHDNPSNLMLDMSSYYHAQISGQKMQSLAIFPWCCRTCQTAQWSPPPSSPRPPIHTPPKHGLSTPGPTATISMQPDLCVCTFLA